MYRFILKLTILVILVTTLVELVTSYLLWKPDDNLRSILIESLGFSILFSFLFVSFMVIPVTKKNLKKMGIDMDSYNWSSIQKDVFIDTPEIEEKLKSKIIKLGFELKENTQNQYIYEKSMSAWSWGDKITLDKKEGKIFITIQPKYSFNIIDYGLNKIKLEELKKEIV